MFRETRAISAAKPDEKPFLSYGFDSPNSIFKNHFHEEDVLIDLINKKSGLIDKNSTVRSLTEMKTNKIELQFHYEYEENREKFIALMKSFLNSVKDLGLVYEVKETMLHVEHNPVLIMDRIHLKYLIEGLKQKEVEPLRKDILQGSLTRHRPVC